MIVKKYFKSIITLGVLLLLSPVANADNEVILEQVGDNLNLDISQTGFKNIVGMLDNQSYINNAPNLSIHIVQFQYANNVDENKIVIDELSGSNNSLKIGQGAHLDDSSDTTFANDGWEGGGHYFELDLYGNNNNIAGYQKNNGNGGHTMNMHIAGSNNDVWWFQKQDGDKTINLTIYNSDNDVSITQRGNNDTHTANITLDGLYGTDFSLDQKGLNPNGAYTYTISQDCVTVGGCSVSVTQGD